MIPMPFLQEHLALSEELKELRLRRERDAELLQKAGMASVS